MENGNREEHVDGRGVEDDSTDSELEELNAYVPLDIPPRDFSRRLVRSHSEPQKTSTRNRMEHSLRKGAHSPPIIQKQRNKVVTQILPRNVQGGDAADKITLVVDDTRFIVERSLFIAHPNTMLGRLVYFLVDTFRVFSMCTRRVSFEIRCRTQLCK